MSTNQKLRLGDTEVVRIGLGTNRLGNTPENVAFVKEAVAAGLSHIDTAHTYAGGESEATIGAALSPMPDDCVVADRSCLAPQTLPDDAADPRHPLTGGPEAEPERARNRSGRCRIR